MIGGRLSGAFIIGLPGNIDLVQAYDPADTWVTRSPVPTPRSGLNTASLNGIIFAAGGEVQTSSLLRAFRARPTIPRAIRGGSYPPCSCLMAALGNRVHVAGGTVQSAIVPLPAGLRFDTDSHEAFELAP